MKLISTDNINKAAFFTSFGATLEKVEGRTPDNIFFVQVPKVLELYEKYVGIVSYRKFSNQRQRLKRLSRRRAGVPEKYRGKLKTGFKLREMIDINLHNEFAKKK